MHPFNELLTSFEKEFKKELQSIQLSEPLNLYEPIAYSLQGGGKRMRPVLLLHAASLFSNRVDYLFPAAFAIELFHNFTLLHDDIMDHAQIRRGLQAVYVKYSENSAILSGDAMSIMAFRYLSKCKSLDLSTILDLFSTTALEVCEGQQYDMEFEHREKVTIPEYLEMIRLKTAVLLACSLKIGALLAGAQKRDCKLLYDFGIRIGLAFQLQDDWLDVYGDENTFGKKIGGDICENKKTFLYLKALELSDDKNRSLLQSWIDLKEFDANQKIKAVRDIYTKSGAEIATRELMLQYHDLAIAALDELNIPQINKQELRNFADSVVDRVK